MAVAVAYRLAYTQRSSIHRPKGTAMPETIAAIALLIADRRLCAACIRSKTRLTNAEFATGLARIAHTVTVDEHQIGHCGACGHATKVFSLKRQATYS